MKIKNNTDFRHKKQHLHAFKLLLCSLLNVIFFAGGAQHCIASPLIIATSPVAPSMTKHDSQSKLRLLGSREGTSCIVITNITGFDPVSQNDEQIDAYILLYYAHANYYTVRQKYPNITDYKNESVQTQLTIFMYSNILS